MVENIIISEKLRITARGKGSWESSLPAVVRELWYSMVEYIFGKCGVESEAEYSGAGYGISRYISISRQRGTIPNASRKAIYLAKYTYRRFSALNAHTWTVTGFLGLLLMSQDNAVCLLILTVSNSHNKKKTMNSYFFLRIKLKPMLNVSPPMRFIFYLPFKSERERAFSEK